MSQTPVLNLSTFISMRMGLLILILLNLYRNYINILPNLVFIYSLFVNLDDVLVNAFSELNQTYSGILLERLMALISTINERNTFLIFR